MNSDKKRFALIMCEERGGWRRLPPSSAQALLERYFTWVDGLAAEGTFKGGDGLYDDVGATLKVVDGELVDGPFTETKEVVAGFFFMDVSGEEEAIALAEACPALDHGRVVEVKAVLTEEAGDPGLLESPSRGSGTMLLVYEPESLEHLPPRRQQQLMGETMGWVEALRARGALHYGAPLSPRGARVGQAGVEAASRLTALYTVGLPFEQALEVARAYPGLEAGAVVDVQPIWDVDDDR